MLRISLWGKQGVCEVDLLPLRIACLVKCLQKGRVSASRFLLSEVDVHAFENFHSLSMIKSGN